MKLLYFAWIRERIGVAEETVEVPETVATVEDLIGWLKGRGETYAQALADDARLKVAVNQAHAGRNAPVSPDDEVAFFPPVTGG